MAPATRQTLNLFVWIFVILLLGLFSWVILNAQLISFTSFAKTARSISKARRRAYRLLYFENSASTHLRPVDKNFLPDKISVRRKTLSNRLTKSAVLLHHSLVRLFFLDLLFLMDKFLPRKDSFFYGFRGIQPSNLVYSCHSLFNFFDSDSSLPCPVIHDHFPKTYAYGLRLHLWFV